MNGWQITACTVAGWLGLSVVVALAVGRVIRANPAPAYRPTFRRCCACEALFTTAHGLADHLIADHPEVLPRVDA